MIHKSNHLGQEAAHLHWLIFKTREPLRGRNEKKKSGYLCYTVLYSHSYKLEFNLVFNAWGTAVFGTSNKVKYLSANKFLPSAFLSSQLLIFPSSYAHFPALTFVILHFPSVLFTHQKENSTQNTFLNHTKDAI